MNNRCIIDARPAYVEHHILPKSLGGSNDSDNKCWLCAECHDKIHNSGAINWIDHLMLLKDKDNAKTK